jgi:hypothetical protein
MTVNIKAAILGFEAQKTRINAQIAKLRAMLPDDARPTAATAEAPTGRRKISAAARRRTKPKRKLSAAGRAAIVAATKSRWDRVRTEW